MISFPGRIPIYISPFFWLLILMIGWLNSASILGTFIWSFVMFISILIHEYGHALTALLFGQKTEIHLAGLGGMTKREGPKIERWKEFMIVLNGPLAGFMIFILAYQFLGIIKEEKVTMVYALKVAINVNLFWTLLNLLPVLPLDGGQLLRILLESIFGLRGLKLAFLISIVLASLMGVGFFLFQQVLLGALFLMLAFESYRAWEEIKEVAPEDAHHHLQDLIKKAVEDLNSGYREEALMKFRSVRQQAPKGMLYVTATQYGARILAEQGNIREAYLWLYPLKSRLTIDYLHFLHQLAYRLQEWEEAIKIGEYSYQQKIDLDTALINALSCAIIGQPTPAVGWLHCATQFEFPQIHKFIEQREFDAIRKSDVFQKWLKSIKFFT